MGDPWNDWYHCNGNTYGTWVRGDARGWRARHHREHVEGDYRSPPPKGTYASLERRSHELMHREPVHLSPSARRLACDTMVETLAFHGIELLVLCVDDHHFHLLARVPDHRPRAWVGLAKKRSARTLSEAGLCEPGGVWAVRSRALPIRDRAHQLNVFRYIARHAARGACVWTFRNRKPASQ